MKRGGKITLVGEASFDNDTLTTLEFNQDLLMQTGLPEAVAKVISNTSNLSELDQDLTELEYSLFQTTDGLLLTYELTPLDGEMFKLVIARESYKLSGIQIPKHGIVIQTG